MRFLGSLASLGLAAGLLVAPAMSAQAAYSQIVAFGDSLSDNGNAFAFSQALIGFGLPATPYWNGRFSNGPVAVEVMAQALGVPLVDSAYGGALTGRSNRAVPFLPGIQTQVDRFVGSFTPAGRTADPSALYFLWGGANDFFSASDPASVLAPAIANLTAEVRQLHTAGARDFFVPLMPDLANTAAALEAGSQAQAQAHALSLQFNAALADAMASLQGSLAGATLRVFDPNPILNATKDSVLAAGGSATPCWTGDYFGHGGTLCADADAHMLWYGVHPTALVHQALGRAMASAVPEPATSGLALVGVLLVAAAMARRRRASAVRQLSWPAAASSA